MFNLPRLTRFDATRADVATTIVRIENLDALESGYGFTGYAASPCPASSAGGTPIISATTSISAVLLA